MKNEPRGVAFAFNSPIAMQTEPRGRGGARAGAGRKPSVGQTPTSVRSFTLDAATIALIEAWRADPRNHAASLSEALRQMVNLAARRRLAVRRWKHSQSVQTSAHVPPSAAPAVA